MKTPNSETVNSDELDTLLSFIKDAQAGKFTEELPAIINVDYHRVEVQEQSSQLENNQNEFILFGIS